MTPIALPMLGMDAPRTDAEALERLDRIRDLSAEVRELARQRDAVILAHHYQVPEVQDVADYVGDSLGLSRKAATTDNAVIAFCGVHFMAETAAMLSPDKTVLIPDLDAGCSLADSITAEQLIAWKAQHPGAVVVSYVNTTAAVKAESDYCCTSGNAKAVIDAIPADRQILFLPDMFLGLWLEKVTGRKLTIWMGECHVHAGIRPEDIDRMTAEDPTTELLVHPECGCASQAMAFANDRTHILSTEGMIRYARETQAPRLRIATETGILHGLRKQVPDTVFEPVPRGRHLPLHEDDHPREAARLAARHEACRDRAGGCRGRGHGSPSSGWSPSGRLALLHQTLGGRHAPCRCAVRDHRGPGSRRVLHARERDLHAAGGLGEVPPVIPGRGRHRAADGAQPGLLQPVPGAGRLRWAAVDRVGVGRGWTRGRAVRVCLHGGRGRRAGGHGPPIRRVSRVPGGAAAAGHRAHPGVVVLTEPAPTGTAVEPVDSTLAAEVATRRTFAIISHPDAGKTTLTEKFLLFSGAIEEAGAVKARRQARSTTSDWMELERQRGISISSTVLRFTHGAWTFNLLDTPGHADFSEDTYRTLWAADAAVVVIDRARGIETQTRKLYRVCRSLLNYIGCAVGGSREPAGDRAARVAAVFRKAVRRTSGESQRMDPLHASLINGISSHVFEYDDTLPKNYIDPSPPVASALFAYASANRVSGRDFVHAFLLWL